MKILSINQNNAYPQNWKQRNVNFEANLVLSLDGKIFKALDPKSATLRKKLLDTRFGRGCRVNLTNFFNDAVLAKIGKSKKEIFIDVTEQEKLAELIKAASEELRIPSNKHARVISISEEVFNRQWNAPKSACANLKKYIEGLIEGAEDVSHDVMKNHWTIYQTAIADVQASFRNAIAKKPEGNK